MRYKIWAQIERYDPENPDSDPVNVSEPIELRVFDSYQGAYEFLKDQYATVYEGDEIEMEV